MPSAVTPYDDQRRDQIHSGPLLQVSNLETHFTTDRGILKAVDDISFELDYGQTIGIVGESGSGKSVTVRSIMNILPAMSAIRRVMLSLRGETSSTSPGTRPSTSGEWRWQ